MTFAGTLLNVAFQSAHRFAAFLAGGRLLPLAFDGGLFVRGAPLHLLKEAVLGHLLLQRLQRRFDLVVEHDDLSCGDHGHGLLTCDDFLSSAEASWSSYAFRTLEA